MKINKYAVVFVSVMMAASLFAGPRGYPHRGPRHHGRPHHSHHHNNAGIAIAAGVVGLIAGAVIASEPPPPQPVYVQQPQVIVQPQPVYMQQPRTVVVPNPTIIMPQSPNSVIVIPQ